MDRTADDHAALAKIMALTEMASAADMGSADEMTGRRGRNRGRSEDESRCE
jgi:hypothetical protein